MKRRMRLEGGGGESVRVEEGATVTLGRGSLRDVSDKRCSRRQIEATVVHRGGFDVIAATAHGVNPAAVRRRGDPPEKQRCLVAGDTADLRVGDTLFLLCDGSYPFVVVVTAEEEAVKAADAKWEWLSDTEWVAYSAAQTAHLEQARRDGKTQVAIDAERFVDLASMEQRRRDDPSKRRTVKRTPIAAAAAAAAPAPLPAVPGKPLDGVVLHFMRKSQRVADLFARLEGLGARLAVGVTPAVTHVVPDPSDRSNGDTLAALAKAGKHLVSLDWVEECLLAGKRMPEAPFAVSHAAGAAASKASDGQPPAKKKQATLFGAPPAAASSAGEVVWFWRRDDGGWEPYDKKISAKIEATYKITGPDAPRRVTIDKSRFVDLFDMKQRCFVNEDLERDVQREVHHH